MWKNAFIAAAFALTLGACATQSAVQAPAAATRVAGCAPNQQAAGSNKDCVSPGASYSADQLRQTGVIDNTAQALQKLDPSITVH
jgi:hypothetical protein